MNQSKDMDEINHFCKDLLKRTIFFAFYISNLKKESPSSSLERFQDHSDLISAMFEISHFKDIADIFFPLDSKIIKSLTNIKRNTVNKILLELIGGFSWNLSPKLHTENETLTPKIFDDIFSIERTENLDHPGLVYTPYNYAAWMVRSCFQRHLARKLKITNFDINDLDSIESNKIKLLKKTISQIQVLDIAIGSGVFYLAALDFLMELNKRLFNYDKSLTIFYFRKILKNNLYGIDINEHVLIICKIRLVLRILRENPLIQINNIFEIINELNIKTGNALVGFTSKPRGNTNSGCSDLDKLLLRGIKDRIVNSQEIINKYKIFHWFNEFPQVFRMPEKSGFDIIIGNPPYIGYRYLGDSTKRVLKHLYPKIYTGLNDYYYYFIWRTKQLLAPKGNCALILARYFLEARYAHKLRFHLFKSNYIDTIIDFREFKIFPRGINSVILFMRNSFKLTKKIPVYIIKNHKISSQSVLHELEILSETNQLQPVLQNFTRIKAEIKNNRLLLVSSTLRDLLNRIVDQGIPLNQVCAIGTGYHSGKDSIFSPNIMEEDKGFFAEIRDIDVITRYPLEHKIIKRIVKSSDILPYRIRELKKKYIIYTERGININDFPLTQQYLENYKELLKNRYEVRKNLAKWYELAQVRNPHIYNAKMKIMCPYRSRIPRFALDKNQRHSSIDCTSLTPKETKFPNIYFLLGVLNSELIEIYLIAVAKKLDAQKIELYPNTISEIPLKIPQTKEEEVLYKDITETTKKICQVLESLEFKPEHHQLLLKYGRRGFSKMKEDVQELLGLTKSLDMLVYQLYGIVDKIETIKSEFSHVF